MRRFLRWVSLAPLIALLILCWLYEEWKESRRVYYKRPESRLDRIIQRAGYWYSQLVERREPKKTQQPNPAGRTGTFLHRKEM